MTIHMAPGEPRKHRERFPIGIAIFKSGSVDCGICRTFISREILFDHRLCCLFLLTTFALVSGQSVSTPRDEESCKIDLKPGTSKVTPTIEKYEAALLMLLGFGGFSVTVAFVYNRIRKHVFKDSHNLDTVFDAGGRVSLSLTAVTVTSQLLWPADFLQSSTLIRKSGIGGSLWFTLAIVIDILLFPTLSLKLKTRAPGAKTFPQIAYARFGKVAHITFCVLALFANLVTTTSLLLAGKAAIEVLTKDSNTEFIMLVLAVLFGSYCLIGGLGTTFYISYFNTALTFISVSVFILQTAYFPTPETEAVASRAAMYKAMQCIEGPEGNYENSLLSFRTRSGIIYGVVLLFMATSISFCDQANWQSRIAAKPSQGVWGFLIAAFIWFSLPTSISFTAAMSYMSMSFQNGTHLLDSGDIENGYITPFVMEALLGSTGGYLLMTMLMMALMSTGSGEVMAISSIIVYDIYKTHINPFRKHLGPTDCVLCGQDKCSNACSCPTALGCKSCMADTELRNTTKANYGIQYSCSVHGMYRHYEDELMRYKSWIMILVIILIVPYGLLIVGTGMNLNWAVMALQVITSPFLIPIFMTITWSKATTPGVVSGGVVGVISCLVAMMVMGSTYEGGLSDFFTNTAKDYSLLAGLVAGFVVGGLLCFVVSLCTHKIKTDEDADKEWAKTMSIDNPLNPYRAIYREELEAVDAGPIITAETMARIFRGAQKVAYIGGSLSIILFIVVIPAVALSYGVLTQDQFDVWLSVCQIWCLICTVLVVLFPPIEEGVQIWRQYRSNAEKKGKMDAFTGFTDGVIDGSDNHSNFTSNFNTNVTKF